MTVPRRSGSNESHSSNSSASSNSWSGLKSTTAASTASSGTQRAFSLSPHQRSTSSSSSSPRAAVFSSLTFFVFPGFDRPALTATIHSYGGNVKSSSSFTLPASSLTAQSPQTLRSLTAAFAFLAAHAEDGRLIPVLEMQDIKLMRELLREWRRERAGRWKEPLWVGTARSVAVYNAALVYDSKRKGRMQDRLLYRVQLLDDEKRQQDENKEQAEPKTAAAVSTASREQRSEAARGQKRKRGSDDENAAARSTAEMDGDDDDDEVEVVQVPSRTPPMAHVGAKRVRLDGGQRQPARQREESKKVAPRKPPVAAAAPPSEEEEEEEEDEIVPDSGDELMQEQQQQQHQQQQKEKGVEDAKEEKDGDAETVETVEGSDGAAADHPSQLLPSLVLLLPRLPLVAVRKEDEGAGAAQAAEPAQQQPAVAAQQQTVKQVTGSDSGGQQRSRDSDGSRSSASESSGAASVKASLAGHIDLTLSQPSQGKDSDIIYETPPSQQQQPSAAAATQPAPTAPAAAAPASPATAESPPSVVPSSTPSSSTPPGSGSSVSSQPAVASPPLSFPFPLPVVLHAIFAHSGSTAAALRYLLQLPCCCARGHEGAEQGCDRCGAVMSWTAAEDALLLAEDTDADAENSRALESARGKVALQQRRLFLTTQTV